MTIYLPLPKKFYVIQSKSYRKLFQMASYHLNVSFHIETGLPKLTQMDQHLFHLLDEKNKRKLLQYGCCWPWATNMLYQSSWKRFRFYTVQYITEVELRILMNSLKFVHTLICLMEHCSPLFSCILVGYLHSLRRQIQDDSLVYIAFCLYNVQLLLQRTELNAYKYCIFHV